MPQRTLRAALALFLLIAGLRSALPERVEELPQPRNYISDFAGVLSPQTQQSLNALCSQVDHRAHAQIAVVTIKSLDGETIENFATNLEDKWKVGPKGSDRGVLLILAVQDRKRRIETGYGLEGILPDSRVGQIGRDMEPALKAGNYDLAVTQAVVQMSQIIAADAGVSLNATPRRGPPQRQQTVKQLSLGEVLIGGIALLVILFFLMKFGPPGLIGFLLGMFLGGGGRGGGGGGGFGGGGGGDDGGGFGGFGGGSSGGGGASGDW